MLNLARRFFTRTDWVLLGLCLAASVFGIIMISSATNLNGSGDYVRPMIIALILGLIMYVLISALIILNIEPESFTDFFEAVYWATVSLTTMGYGDIYPISSLGRAFTMVSAIFGIAIIALPAGIITAGYMDILQEDKKEAQLKQGQHRIIRRGRERIPRQIEF